MKVCHGGLRFNAPLLSSPYSLSHCFIQVSGYFIYLGCYFIPDFFVIQSCCQMVTHWVWSRAIITFVSSLQTIHSFLVFRWIMAWSSFGSVVRHCLPFAFIRQYNVILSFDIAYAGGLLCPSFWSTSCRRWCCHSIAICDATGSDLTRLWAHGHAC